MAAELSDDPHDGLNRDHPRHIGAIDEAQPAGRGRIAQHHLVPVTLGIPLQSLPAFGDVRGARRQLRRIEPVGFGQPRAHRRPLEIWVGVGRVDDGGDPGIGDHGFELGFAPTEQRAQEHHAAAFDPRGGAHAGQTRQPARPIEAHQQRFGLIIGMMRGGNRAEPQGLRPARQRRIAPGPRLRLQVPGLRRERDRGEGNAMCRSQPLDQRNLARRLGPQAVINAADSNPARQRGLRKQHQREAVRPARNGQPERSGAVILRPQRRQIGSEARHA